MCAGAFLKELQLKEARYKYVSGQRLGSVRQTLLPKAALASPDLIFLATKAGDISTCDRNAPDAS